jgi:hypothetical protein
MRIVVDDRAFVVGLSELFRQEMKSYEVATLLPLAETACEALDLSPANVPVEGYYTESVELERFFRLIRALQNAEVREVFPGSAKDAMFRLREVLASPAMGRVESDDRLLPRTTSPLGEALLILSNWSIDGLSRQAAQLVRRDDAGLIAVAAAAGDPVALCVARESMALVADVEFAEIELPEFVWAVSERVAEVASRFVSALAEATGILLPEPETTSSRLYGQAARDAELVGRCILIGERFGNPYPYYHWWIDSQDGQLRVKDFWSSNVWTTDTFRNMPNDMRPATGAQVGAPRLGSEPSGEGIRSSVSPRKEVEEQQGRKGWFARLFQRSR